MRACVRLGVYADLVYRQEQGVLSTDRAFVTFVTSLPPRVDEVVLFGRLDPEPGRSPYTLDGDAVRLVPLPHYASLRELGGLARSLREARRRFAAELDRLDAVWLFGPHPLSFLFASAARRRGVPVFLGVRQDLPTYIGNRLPGRRWVPALLGAHVLERGYRWLARSAPTVVVGDSLGDAYGRRGADVLATGFSLVRDTDLRPLAAALAVDWDGEIELLSVGRLDSEKNPLLLPEILAGLPARWRLRVVGQGPLEGALRDRARALGVEERIELSGYLRHGEDLWRAFHGSHAFLHVSRTEGLPQVLFEAAAAGLPVVATAVGGVAAAVGHGERALLVPPDDAGAAVAALRRLELEPELRRRLVTAGLEHAASETLDAQLDRVAAFLRSRAVR